MRIASQAFPYAAFLFGIGLVSLAYPPARLVSIPFWVLGLFVTFFFRDPERTPPGDPRLLVSPADGRVVFAGELPDGSGRRQVSIFLSLFDVHINRSPLEAVIASARYTPGRFIPAYRPEASARNEQNEITLEDGDFRVLVRQIAGVVARRIVFTKKAADRVARGERIGLIQFGSRVDTLFPATVRLRVAVGDRVRGGESVLAERP